MTVSLQLGNTTVSTCITNKGGTHSPQISTLALELWYWCEAEDIPVIACHIPGRDNMYADTESRVFKDMSEWKLNPTITTLSVELSDGSVCKSPYHSFQGLHQLEARPRDHPHRCSIHWAPLKGCSFPSLEKVMVDKTEIILVAPFWQAQHWWPVLLKLLISQLVLYFYQTAYSLDGPVRPQESLPNVL